MQAAALATQSFFGSVAESATTQLAPALSITLHAGQLATDVQRMSFCAWAQLLLEHWLEPVQTVPLGFFAWHTFMLVLQ
jgi:hypothetical protein